MQFHKFIVAEPVAAQRLEARSALKGRAGAAMLAGFLFLVITGLPGNLILALSGAAGRMVDIQSLESLMSGMQMGQGLPAAYGAMFSSVLVYFLYFLLITGPFRLSMSVFYLRYRRRQEAEAGLLFYGFGHFARSLAMMLLISIFSAAWFLVVYIPGAFLGAGLVVTNSQAGVGLGMSVIILAALGGAALMVVKLFQYQLAFFLLADHPELTALECINSSKFLMLGNRGKLFLLNLSFIGWMILAVIGMNIIDAPFLNILSMLGVSGSAGGQVAYAVVSALALGLAQGLLRFYMGIANAAFYEKACGKFVYAPLSQQTLPE